MFIDILVFAFFFVISLALMHNFKDESSKVENNYSIVIPVRNEEKHLKTLFKYLNKIEYPDDKFEIILVDDASKDRSLELIRKYAVKKNVDFISLNEEDRKFKGKKSALQKGIEKTKFDHILFTDADCMPPRNWLSKMNQYMILGVSMVVGYSPEKTHSKFRRFSQLFSAAMYAVTIGLGFPFSCSGRNLAIRKDSFRQVGGVKKKKEYESGDDKLLLNLFRENDKVIVYNPEAPVYTKPAYNEKEQSKRRYGKFSMSSNLIRIVQILILVYFIYLPASILFNPQSIIIYFLGMLLLWISNLIKHKEKFEYIDLVYFFVYPYYLIFYSFLGNIKGWKWKNN